MAHTYATKHAHIKRFDGVVVLKPRPALSRLIRAHLKFTKRGARVTLCNLDKRIENIFVITKLSLVCPVYPDEESAIAGCAGEPH